jgi:hypothetical protein
MKKANNDKLIMDLFKVAGIFLLLKGLKQATDHLLWDITKCKKVINANVNVNGCACFVFLIKNDKVNNNHSLIYWRRLFFHARFKLWRIPIIDVITPICPAFWAEMLPFK